MSGARVRILLLIVNLGLAAAIALTFVSGLRGIHRFPVEVAIYVGTLLTVLFSNAAYIWWYRRP